MVDEKKVIMIETLRSILKKMESRSLDLSLPESVRNSYEVKHIKLRRSLILLEG